MKDIRNCPNCGAPLSQDGSCDYCGTKVNRTNNINVLANGGYTHITLNVTDENGDIYILPMSGTIDNVSISSDTFSATDYLGRTITLVKETNVNFNFSGRLEDKINE